MKPIRLTFPKADFLVEFAKSFLTAYALRAVFHAPLDPYAYETGQDYAIASIYELLGTYDLMFLFLLILALCFYSTWARRSPEGSSSVGLSCFFAACLLLGRSYYEIGDSSYCFGSAVNFVKSLLSFAGFAILFHALIRLIYGFFDRARSGASADGAEHFFTHRPFLKSFLILIGCYAPFLLLAFPGKLCWDAIGQIEQVIGSGGYNTHHPLFHTLIMGGFVRAGQTVFGSAELGLFGYMLLQDGLLAGALAATIAVLARRGAKCSLLSVLLLLYCVTPVYSNMASTAVKDVPYAAAVVGYVVCLALLLERPGRIRDRGYAAAFLLLQIGVILLRNNGLYVVLLTGLGCFFFLYKKYGLRERILYLLTGFGGSVLTAKLILLILAQVCSATPGSVGEMLSVPFQQTARYLQLYREELDPWERSAIEEVLGDVDTVAARYDPDSSDPVKALYRKDAPPAHLAAYMKAWLHGLGKHPGTYFEAFFLHIYGWFTPSVANSIRYEADEYDAVRQGGLFPGAEKLLIFYYRFISRFTLLGVLENMGAAVWALFVLCFYQRKRGLPAAAWAGLPLWISLLICMASPCFFNHPRYAFPILFSLPFLYGFTLTIAPDGKAQARK